jgi:ATP synthase subunit D
MSSGAGVSLLFSKLSAVPNSHALQKEAVFPTRQSLGLMKSKLKGAETGHSLLKRKSEALTKYVRLGTVKSI